MKIKNKPRNAFEQKKKKPRVEFTPQTVFEQLVPGEEQTKQLFV